MIRKKYSGKFYYTLALLINFAIFDLRYKLLSHLHIL